MYNNLLNPIPRTIYKIEFFQFRTPQILEILKEGDGDISDFHNSKRKGNAS